jgi:ABC-type glycerol-3-phosphate transport system substrate-binding protein
LVIFKRSRKSALVFLMLCIMVLILSPWVDAPSSTSIAVTEPEKEAFAPALPIIPQEITMLTVEVALEAVEFNALVDQNIAFELRHPDINVELLRIEPEQAYLAFKQSSEMEESADIMLLENEWVKEFAASGYLLPADAAFVGKALAEQFDALATPLKWNGYLWGVPRSLDPYVLVWNADLLGEWLGADAVLPLTIEQWTALTAKSAQLQGTTSWLTLDPNDPLALLAWLENTSGERSDGLWTKGSKPWDGTLFEQALSMLEQQRTGVTFADTKEEAGRLLKEGETLAAIIPYSKAATLIAEPRLASNTNLEIDHQSWKLPYIWPRGSSFAISSHTEAEDAVHTWIAEMTDVPIQLQNMEESSRLPVYRSLYESDRLLSNLLPGKTGQSFPNQSPLVMGPDLPARLKQLSILWSRFAAGEIGLGDWKKQWTESLANFQLDD